MCTDGSHESEIRTPAIIKGGLVEDILRKNTNLINNKCEYNGLFHVSDWYHVFMNINNINNADYKPDSDHSQLKIWNNIKCNCLEDSECDSKYRPRGDIIAMTSGRGYIRKGDYKLVVK